MFVIKDSETTKKEFMYLNIGDSNPLAESRMTDINNVKKYSSYEEARQDLVRYQNCFSWRYKGYFIEEIKDDLEALQTIEYYVLCKTYSEGSTVFRTKHIDSPSAFLSNALRFADLKNAINNLSNHYHICKVVEKVTVHKIDHEKELKKLEKEKLQKEKDSLTAKLKEINDKLQKIS